MVKQVFSRSMGVWMFAVALLVGVVFCVTLHELDQMDNRVKGSSIYFLDYLLELKASGEANGSHREWQAPFKLKMEKMVGEGEKLLCEIQPVVNLTLDKLFETDYEVVEGLPPPVGPNSMKAVRVKRFGESLLGVLGELKRFAGGFNTSAEISTDRQKFIEGISRLTTNHFPFIEGDNRYADLSKTTIEVSLEEVLSAHEEMTLNLRPYVPPLASNTRRKRRSNKGSVVKWFLKLQGGRIETDILDKLDFLYRNNRFYRLAACGAHIIYLKHYPGAFSLTRKLQKIVRGLNNFANALSTIMRALTFRKEFDPSFYPQQVYDTLEEMDPTVTMWHSGIVYHLREVLNLKLDKLEPLSRIFNSADRNVSNMGSFSKVLAEVEEMSKFHVTYYHMQSYVCADDDRSKTMALTDIKYLVANMDEKARHLSDKLSSDEVQQVCAVWKPILNVHSGICGQLGEIMGLLCTVSEHACSIQPAGIKNETHYSMFQKKMKALFPNEPSMRIEAIVGEVKVSRELKDWLRQWKPIWHSTMLEFHHMRPFS